MPFLNPREEFTPKQNKQSGEKRFYFWLHIKAGCPILFIEMNNMCVK